MTPTLETARRIYESSVVSHTDEATLKEWRNRQLEDMRVIRAATRGGRDAIVCLNVPGGAEKPEDYAGRLINASNFPMCHMTASAYADFCSRTRPKFTVYLGDTPPPTLVEQFRAKRRAANGETVESKLHKHTEVVSGAFGDVLEKGGFWGLHREWCYRRNRDGRSHLKLYAKQGDGGDLVGYGFAIMDREDVYVLMDPDDPCVRIAAWEWRARGGHWRFWNAETWQDVGEDWKPMSDPVPHEFGSVPFVTLGSNQAHGMDGSLLKDVVTTQREVNSRGSIDWAGQRKMVWPIMWGKGRPSQDVDTDDAEPDGYEGGGGSRPVRTGPSIGPIWLEDGPHDTEASLNMLSPGLPISEMRDCRESVIEEGFRAVGLKAIFSGGIDAPAEQPTTIALRMTDTLGVYSGLVLELYTAWESLVPLVLTSVSGTNTPQYGAVPEIDVTEARYKLEYPDNPFPHNNAQEREQDRRDVDAGLMTIEDYLLKHRDIETPEELEAMVLALKEQDRQRNSVPSLFSSGFGAPPNGGGL